MRIETLFYFQEAVRCKSFTQASRNLYVSQQGISKAIASLEKELSATLFIRDERGLELTEDGQLLLELSYSITHSYERLIDRFSQRHLERESFRGVEVVAMTYICNRLYNCLENDLRIYGLDECVFVERDLPDILARVESGELDFAIINVLREDYEAIVKSRPFRFLPLFSMDVTVLAPTSLAAQYGEGPLTPAEVMSLPLAYYNEPVLNRIADSLAACSACAPPAVLQHSSNHGSIVSLMEKGKAATFCDTFSYFSKKPKANITMLKIDPAPVVYVGFLVNSEAGEKPELHEFFRRFKKSLAERHGDYVDNHPVLIV